MSEAGKASAQRALPLDKKELARRSLRAARQQFHLVAAGATVCLIGSFVLSWYWVLIASISAMYALHKQMSKKRPKKSSQ